jgi:hypothetical protein
LSSYLLLCGSRGAKVGSLEVEVGDMVALASEDEDEGLQFALLQALWQTTSKAKMMQVCSALPPLPDRSGAQQGFHSVIGAGHAHARSFKL